VAAPPRRLDNQRCARWVNPVIFTYKEISKVNRSSTISSKGQVTVPLEVRKRLGLKAGDRVEFVFRDSDTIMRPERSPDNPFLKYVGAAPTFSNIQEVNAWVRSLREEDDEPRKKK
jgi:antitoxin PrlF